MNKASAVNLPKTKLPFGIKLLFWWLPFLTTQILVLGLAALFFFLPEPQATPEKGWGKVFGVVLAGLDLYFVLPIVVAIGIIGTAILLVRRYKGNRNFQ